MAFTDCKSLETFLRVVLVDGKYLEPLQETEVKESIDWEDFVQVLYNMTKPVMSSIVRFVTQKPQGEGLSIDDGDWWYRIVDPINQSTNATILPTFRDANKGAWKFLNCRTGFRHMMDQVYYMHGIGDAFIEVQHQMQRDTIDLEQQLEDAAEQDMIQDMEVQAQEELPKLEHTQTQPGFRGYHDQPAQDPVHFTSFQPAINPHFTQHGQFQLQYTAHNTLHPPMTKVEIAADQVAAMAAAVGFSFARDLPPEAAISHQPTGTGAPPADVQARRRFLGGHANSKRKDAETKAEEMEEVEVKKERKKKRKLVEVVAEETEEKERKEDKKKEQATSRAARAARRSGGL